MLCNIHVKSEPKSIHNPPESKVSREPKTHRSRIQGTPEGEAEARAGAPSGRSRGPQTSHLLVGSPRAHSGSPVFSGTPGVRWSSRGSPEQEDAADGEDPSLPEHASPHRAGLPLGALGPFPPNSALLKCLSA